MVGLGSSEVDPAVGTFTGQEPAATVINVTKKFGKSGFRVWWEYLDLSDTRDTLGFDGKTQHKIGGRVDF